MSARILITVSSMLVAEKQAEKAEVRSMPGIRTAGNYEELIYFPSIPGSTTSTHAELFDGTVSTETFIAMASIRVEAQTSGKSVFLGEATLSAGTQAYVTVTNMNADGAIVADTVLFVPHYRIP